MEDNNFRSKKLFKLEEDTCKKFTAECLKGDPVHAIDIDTLFCINGTWYIFEYLKCDSILVNPYTSDPSKYAYNWKKFYTLWQITKQLKGKLFLINYGDKLEYSDMVRVMKVKDIDLNIISSFMKMNYQELKNFRKPYIYYDEDMKMTKEKFSNWLRKINREASCFTLNNEKEQI